MDTKNDGNIIFNRLSFEVIGVHRRCALQLIPYVKDPEINRSMHFSQLKSSRQYNFISKDKVSLDGGYRLCRTTRFLPNGDKDYYFEFKFNATNENSHVRFGISTIEAKLEYPVGCDKHGYSVCDNGCAFHRGINFKSTPFRNDDIVGIGIFHLEDKLGFRLFINGNDKGIIFDDIDQNKLWFPAVSIYNGAVVEGTFDRPFQNDPGESWDAANDLPKYETDDLFTSNLLVKVMKGEATVPKQFEKEMLEAIDVVLTPSHLMPI